MNEEMMKYLMRRAGAVEAEIARVMPRNAKPREVYGLLWDMLERGGKRFRPAMCLLACEAVGGRPADALPAAAAIELFHTMTLIHDDIEDDSHMRRGRPCLHVQHGIPLALNAGDGLFMMVWRALDRMKTTKERLEVERVLREAFVKVLEGQSIELGWYRSGKFGVSEKDYVGMVKGKTGVLIGAACEVGVIMGRGSARQRKAMHEFGEAVGVAFQIQDDILNLTGSEEKYRKEIGGDVREGKRTLMVIYALQKADAREREEIVRALGSGNAGIADVARVVEIMNKYGALGKAEKYAKGLVVRAKKGLFTLRRGGARARLEGLADFLVDREI